MLQHDVHEQARQEKPSPTIAENRKARYDYFIEERFEAGLVLEGWEVKIHARRQGADRRRLRVPASNGEAFLFGAQITPLQHHLDARAPGPEAHAQTTAARHQLDRLVGASSARVTRWCRLTLHWKNGRAKLEIGLAKGKKQHDKRATEKDRDWQRDKARLLKRHVSRLVSRRPGPTMLLHFGGDRLRRGSRN